MMPETVAQRPAQLITFVDEQQTLNDGFFSFGSDCVSITHTHGFISAFFDGHAKWSHSSVGSNNVAVGQCADVLHGVTGGSHLDKLFCPTFPFNYDSAGFMQACQTPD